ncbi:MAG: lipoate--protein ligase family protein, partial [Planctomycetes bacterium]|nr:lipoate--protein ligase family protein [Planctomycetota bacterium]
MAIDEALLDCAKECTLRLYDWDKATVSLGYFQDYQNVQSSIQGNPEWVRRITGGGAIWHEYEVTYCLIADRGVHLPEKSLDCYRLLHHHILQEIKVLGGDGDIQTVQKGDKTYAKEVRCFASPASQDIVAHAGGKIVGSAARSRGNRTLIHGSLKLQTNDWDREQAHGCGLDREQAFLALEKGILGALKEKSSGGALTTQECDRANEIEEIRYGN